MAVFDWVNTPETGMCITCMTSQNDRGFVKFHSDVNIMRNEYEIAGFVEAVLCGDCLLQAARLVGAATPAETEDFARRELELVEENEKLADEVKAWSERLRNLVGLDESDVTLKES